MALGQPANRNFARRKRGCNNTTYSEDVWFPRNDLLVVLLVPINQDCKNVVMTARTRDREWVQRLYPAMQAAIGQQLKAELEAPDDLTPELVILLNGMPQEKEGASGSGD